MDMTGKEQADMEAFGVYYDLEQYIEENHGRFFCNSKEQTGKLFFDELEKFLSRLEKNYVTGQHWYRARILKGQTGHRDFSSDCDNFEGYSQKDLGAPPATNAADGRANPKGVSVLYLADSRRTALSEVRPSIASSVSIGRGTLQKDVSIISFASAQWDGLSTYEKSFVDLVSGLFSHPLNGQNPVEYLPSQIVTEYIRNAGFDGLEFKSAQHKGGLNLVLFDVKAWKADSSKVFEVQNITYDVIRDPALVEVFGYPDEEL